MPAGRLYASMIWAGLKALQNKLFNNLRWDKVYYKDVKCKNMIKG